MTAPRIPRARPPVIHRTDHPAWYESTLNRVLAIVVIAAFGGVLVNAALAWAAA